MFYLSKSLVCFEFLAKIGVEHESMLANQGRELRHSCSLQEHIVLTAHYYNSFKQLNKSSLLSRDSFRHSTVTKSDVTLC